MIRKKTKKIAPMNERRLWADFRFLLDDLRIEKPI